MTSQLFTWWKAFIGGTRIGRQPQDVTPGDEARYPAPESDVVGTPWFGDPQPFPGAR